MTAQLLRAFGVYHDFPEARLSMQGSQTYLTRRYVLPLSVLLGLVFPGTHFEKAWPTGNTGGLGLGVDSVANFLCVPGPAIFLMPSPHVLWEGGPQTLGSEALSELQLFLRRRRGLPRLCLGLDLDLLSS